MRHALAIILSGALVVGCVETDGSPDSAPSPDVASLDDTRSPISDCSYGLFWADCGGTGEPALGCDRTTGDCRWFEGGETARGYAISACPSSAVCCHDDWPFTDFAPSEQTLRNASGQLNLLSRGVISRAPTNAVPILADFDGETSLGRIRCEGFGFEPCDTAGGSVERVGDAVVVRAGSPWGPSGLWHLLEIVIVDAPEDSLVRLYRFRARFEEPGDLQLECDGLTHPEEIVGLTALRVNTLDTSDLDAFHGRVEGSTPSADTYSIEF